MKVRADSLCAIASGACDCMALCHRSPASGRVVTSDAQWFASDVPGTHCEFYMSKPESAADKIASDGGRTGYYDLPTGAEQLQDLIEHRRMNFSVGNIFKAAYRLGAKDGVSDLYDLNKIVFFAQREIARIKAMPPA